MSVSYKHIEFLFYKLDNIEKHIWVNITKILWKAINIAASIIFTFLKVKSSFTMVYQ